MENLLIESQWRWWNMVLRLEKCFKYWIIDIYFIAYFLAANTICKHQNISNVFSEKKWYRKFLSTLGEKFVYFVCIVWWLRCNFLFIQKTCCCCCMNCSSVLLLTNHRKQSLPHMRILVIYTNFICYDLDYYCLIF